MGVQKWTPIFYVQIQKGGDAMYFTSGQDRAFERLMQEKPGFDHYDSGGANAPEDCGSCRFYAAATFSVQSAPVPPASRVRAAQSFWFCLPYFTVLSIQGVWGLPQGSAPAGVSLRGCKQNGRGPAGAGRAVFSGVWLHFLCLLRYCFSANKTFPNSKTTRKIDLWTEKSAKK